MSTQNESWRKAKPWAAIVALTLLVLLVAGVIAWRLGFGGQADSSPDPRARQHDARPAHAQAESAAETPQSLIVGTWEDDYQGHRTLTVRDDGTATMVIELEGVAALLYAKRMTFDEEWTIEDGRVRFKVLRGEPENRVKLVLDVMGDETTQEILELTRERMLLLDADGTTKFDWRRTGPSE